jgi:hypothetical protein
MRLELLIIGLTIFFIFNTYHNGKYTKLLMSYKKYYTMGFIALLGISFYLLIKRNPAKCKNILLHANNMIKYMPIDKSSMDMISPIIDFTQNSEEGDFSSTFMGNLNQQMNPQQSMYERKILESGGAAPMMGMAGGAVKATKRSVSETKKKYVASMQDWKCKHCKKTLTAWFEVDHVKRLEHGGNNDVTNLVALCRECHGQKTAFENM